MTHDFFFIVSTKGGELATARAKGSRRGEGKGVYGLLVLLAIVITPFLRIGIQYLLLKLTSAVCGLFCEKNTNALLDGFSAAMGLLLAMTGTVCLLLMISVMCFLRGMG